MLDCNTYVIKGAPSIIIDPGSPQFLPALVRDLQADGISPRDIDIIANTHLHGDHCWANTAFKQISAARIAIHPVQQEFYDVTVVKTSEFFGFQPAGFEADFCLDNSSLDTGDLKFELIHSPGHSPDSICFYCQQANILICGDVIFCENTGRVDLPGGNAAELKQSVEGLSGLKIEYLLPGHMGVVTGAEGVKHNFEFISQHVLSRL